MREACRRGTHQVGRQWPPSPLAVLQRACACASPPATCICMWRQRSHNSALRTLSPLSFLAPLRRGDVPRAMCHVRSARARHTMCTQLLESPSDLRPPHARSRLTAARASAAPRQGPASAEPRRPSQRQSAEVGSGDTSDTLCRVVSLYHVSLCVAAMCVADVPLFS